jgi:hypothetical protein
MFNTHKKLQNQLVEFVDEILRGDHPTLENLRQQNEHDIHNWELLTDHKGYKVGGKDIERPPQGTAILNAIYTPTIFLPTVPTIELLRGKITHPSKSTAIQTKVWIYEGKLSRIVFNTEDNSSFPPSMKGWKYTDFGGILNLPVYEVPNYSKLNHPFEKWLMAHIAQSPNGDPKFPVEADWYPSSFGHFHRVFTTVDVDDIRFFSPSECSEIDYQGRNYLAFGQDDRGNPYCFADGHDKVYFLDHDDPEEIVEVGSFEELIKETWGQSRSA